MLSDDVGGSAQGGFGADLAALGARVVELEHDLAAIVRLLSAQMGEPFRSLAAEIIAKRQTGEKG